MRGLLKNRDVKKVEDNDFMERLSRDDIRSLLMSFMSLVLFMLLMLLMLMMLLMLTCRMSSMPPPSSSISTGVLVVIEPDPAFLVM